MSDLMLLGALRSPVPFPVDAVWLHQLVGRAQEAADRIEADAAAMQRLRGEQAVLVRLLVQCEIVLSTLEGENTDEQEMLDGLRRAIRNATTPHRPEEADLLAVRERLGA